MRALPTFLLLFTMNHLCKSKVFGRQFCDLHTMKGYIRGGSPPSQMNTGMKIFSQFTIFNKCLFVKQWTFCTNAVTISSTFIITGKRHALIFGLPRFINDWPGISMLQVELSLGDGGTLQYARFPYIFYAMSLLALLVCLMTSHLGNTEDWRFTTRCFTERLGMKPSYKIWAVLHVCETRKTDDTG